MSERIEITLSEERLAALDEARGNEPRASFIKRWTDKGIAEERPAVVLETTRDLRTPVGDGLYVQPLGAPAYPNVPVPHSRAPSNFERLQGAEHKANCKCPVCRPAKAKR